MQDHTLILLRASLPIPKNNKGKLRRLHKASLSTCPQVPKEAICGPQGPRGPSASRPARCSAQRRSFCLAGLEAPASRLPRTPSLWIFLHTHHSPTSCSGFLSLGPSPRNSGLFSKATRGPVFSTPARVTRVRGGVWDKKRERGTQSKADLTAAASPPPPPLQSSLKSANSWLEKQPSHPAPHRASHLGPPPPPKVYTRA